MDLRWGYNNVRIKEGDEWKAAFMMPEGLFKPMVIFFRLTNSPATFQVMMNKLFELVAKIIKRLEENDLYVKPEKCKWKVREVRFLGVVIGPKGIKMEKEKMKDVLE